MLMWIFFWWLLGVLVMAAVNWRNLSVESFQYIELGDALGVLLGGFAWPLFVVVQAIEYDWLDMPIFDLDWFRREEDDE